MARARIIKPAFFHNDALADLDALTRLLFAGLWCIADREGRLEFRPKKIKADVLPYDNCDPEKMLIDLHNAGFILIYEVDKVIYIQIVNFNKHQKPHNKEVSSSIPAPIKDVASTNLGEGSPQPRTLPARPLTLNPLPLTLNPLPQQSEANDEKANRGTAPHLAGGQGIERRDNPPTRENGYGYPAADFTPYPTLDGQTKFEEFWRAYPKSGGNNRYTRAAYEKAILRASHETIMKGLKAYCKAQPWGDDAKYAKAPHEWLDNEMWKEEHKDTSPHQDNRRFEVGVL